MGRNQGTEFSLKLLKVFLDEPGVEKKVKEIQRKANELKVEDKISNLLLALSLVDLTTLNGNEVPADIDKLCQKAAKPFGKDLTDPIHPAAICVYPLQIKNTIDSLKKWNLRDKVEVGSVAAGFPSGQYPLETRLQEIKYAISYGADEIDVVINRTLALTEEWQELYEELKAMREACGSAVMKTILATGDFSSLRQIYIACMVAMMAGCDFVKTSTGKEKINATLPVGVVMCKAVKDYEERSGYKVGFKPAGGIKTAKDALEWVTLVSQELGNSWLNKEMFRIGASSVVDDIVQTLKSYEQFKL